MVLLKVLGCPRKLAKGRYVGYNPNILAIHNILLQHAVECGMFFNPWTLDVFKLPRLHPGNLT